MQKAGGKMQDMDACCLPPASCLLHLASPARNILAARESKVVLLNEPASSVDPKQKPGYTKSFSPPAPAAPL